MPPHCDSIDGAVVNAAIRAFDEGSVELVLPFVLFDSKGNLQRVAPGVGGVHSNGWVKTPIEARRQDGRSRTELDPQPAP